MVSRLIAGGRGRTDWDWDGGGGSGCGGCGLCEGKRKGKGEMGVVWLVWQGGIVWLERGMGGERGSRHDETCVAGGVTIVRG